VCCFSSVWQSVWKHTAASSKIVFRNHQATKHRIIPPPPPPPVSSSSVLLSLLSLSFAFSPSSSSSAAAVAVSNQAGKIQAASSMPRKASSGNSRGANAGLFRAARPSPRPSSSSVIATLRQVIEIADDESLLLLDHATNHSTVLVDNARCTAPTTDGLPVAVWLCPHCTPTGLRLLLVCRPLGRTGHYRHVGLVIFAVRCCGGRRCGCVPPPWLSTGRRSWVAGQLTDPPRRRGGTLMPDHTAARHGASAARARQRRLEVVEVVVHHFELATRLVV